MTSAIQLTVEMEDCVLSTVGQGDGLIIAILGPVPSDDQKEIFGWKRNQIRAVLRNDGAPAIFSPKIALRTTLLSQVFCNKRFC